MFLPTPVSDLRVGDRFQAPLGPRVITHIFRVGDKYSIGQDDGPVLWQTAGSYVMAWKEII